MRMRRRALVLLLATGVALAGCGRLYFFPDGQLRVLPSQLGLAYEDLFLASGEETLHAWFLPAVDVPDPAPGVLFLHGNAENISSHVGSVHWLPAHGFHVLLFDYRGYGNSTGRPDLEGVELDAEAALRTLRARPEVDPERIVVFGQSLGGSIALPMLERVQQELPVAAVVVDSAFASYRGIARDKLAQVWITWPLQWPLSFLFPDDPRPVESIARLEVPSVLVVHGEADEVVPIEHGRRLTDAAPEGTAFWSVPGAGHIQVFADPEWQRRLVDHLRAGFEAARRRSTSSPPEDAATS